MRFLFHLEYATVDASNRIWIGKDFKKIAKEQGLEVFIGFAPDGENPMLTYAALMTVVESNNPDHKKGELYVGCTVLAEYVVLTPKDVPFGLSKFDPVEGMPDSYALGPLGLTSGLTAWVSVMNTQTRFQPMSKTVDLQKGDKVYVSAGSGAVGMMVTQLYKSLGADVIASTGSDEKVAFLQKELGITAFNYKTKDIRTELAAFAPDGLQYYFDNVGGPTLEAAIDSMAHYGNIVLCGMVSAYGKEKPGIHNLMHAVGRQLNIRGFLSPQWADQWPTAIAALSEMIASGALTWKEDRFSWDDFPAALDGLLTGTKFGKTILVGNPIQHSEL